MCQRLIRMKVQQDGRRIDPLSAVVPNWVTEPVETKKKHTHAYIDMQKIYDLILIGRIINLMHVDPQLVFRSLSQLFSTRERHDTHLTPPISSQSFSQVLEAGES